MHDTWRRSLAVAALGALALFGCSEDGAGDGQAAPEQDGADAPEQDGADAPDPGGDGEDAAAAEDPNDDVEDGVYRGNGVVLPVPEGWSLDPGAFAQGAVVAVSDDGTQQLSAQAIDGEALEDAGQPMDLDTLLDSVRQLGEPDVDEEIELQGAERAHRVTFLDLPAQQEGAPDSSATVVLAERPGVVAEFVAGAPSDDYSDELESLLLEQAGLDPDSEPPEPQAPPAPAPEGEGGEPEEAPEEPG